MFELLTEQDKNNIACWIDHYAPQNGDGYLRPEHEMGELSYLLRYWNSAKNEFLGKVFGGQLILSRPYTYKTPMDTIYNNMRKKLYRNPSWNRISDFIAQATTHVGCLNELRYGLWELSETYTLANNNCERIFDRLFNTNSQIVVELPNGKSFKIQRTMKPLKLIYKLLEGWADSLGYTEWYSDYENVRIIQSQCLNTADLHGTLCLSIHPLDYMTMSDNENDWTSCMRWRRNGEYSQGTVEMMNSATVVVAYLHNPDKPMTLPNDMPWSNKIWRQLFVVDEAMITEVKPYPYDDENITMTCLEWLKELVGGDFTNMHMEDSGDTITIDDTEKVCFNFDVGFMYSDFGTMSRSHNIAINIPFIKQYCDIDEYTNSYYISINYSGASECMWCGGDITDDWDDEETSGRRICENCYSHIRCSCCGRAIVSDDYYYDADGNIICCNCHDEYYDYDSIREECYHRDCLTTIFLAKDFNIETNTPNLVHGYIQLCDYDIEHFSELNEYFTTKEYHNYHHSWYGVRHYVFVDECTQRGLDLFAYHS